MSDTHTAIEAMWKVESTRLIAGIARVTRDIGIAEELAQDALVAALERWPDEGIPDKPAAWLMTAAKRRAIDRLRRGRMLALKHGEIESTQLAFTFRESVGGMVSADDVGQGLRHGKWLRARAFEIEKELGVGIPRLEQFDEL